MSLQTPVHSPVSSSENSCVHVLKKQAAQEHRRTGQLRTPLEMLGGGGVWVGLKNECHLPHSGVSAPSLFSSCFAPPSPDFSTLMVFQKFGWASHCSRAWQFTEQLCGSRSHAWRQAGADAGKGPTLQQGPPELSPVGWPWAQWQIQSWAGTLGTTGWS